MKPPKPRHRVLVSAENNAYIAWQAKLLHFSCVRRLGHAPLIVVHDAGGARRESLHPDFADIIAAGGTVERAPAYRLTRRGHDYPCRNLPGTLLHAARLPAPESEEPSFFVLCDPDMLFVRRRRRGSPRFPESLSGEFYSYIDYDRGAVRAAAARLGLTPERMSARGDELLGCGSPYVVPCGEVARALAAEWLECVDAFDPPGWVDVMYAFGLAAARLGLPVTTTHLVTSNTAPDAALGNAVILHYCYGDETWDKRHFTAEDRAEAVWDSPARVSAPRATALGEILSQIGEARAFYDARPRERSAPGDETPSAQVALSLHPEGELLLCCARTSIDATAVARIRTLLAGPGLDPARLLRLAHYHRTMPLLFWSLNAACSGDIPTALRAALDDHFHANAARGLFLTGELIRLSKAFEESRIPALPLGGPVLAAAAYGNVALREAGELSVGVFPRDLPEADELLRAAGYVPPATAATATDGEPGRVYQGEDGRVTVALSPLGEDFWGRRREINVAGATLPAPSHADLLLTLCLRGSHSGWERLESVTDVAELVRAQNEGAGGGVPPAPGIGWLGSSYEQPIEVPQLAQR